MLCTMEIIHSFSFCVRRTTKIDVLTPSLPITHPSEIFTQYYKHHTLVCPHKQDLRPA